VAVPHTNRNIQLLPLVGGLHRVSLDASNQAIKQVWIKDFRILKLHRNREGINIESRYHIHRSQRQLDRIGDRLQGSKAQLIVGRTDLDQTQAKPAATRIAMLD